MAAAERTKMDEAGLPNNEIVLNQSAGSSLNPGSCWVEDDVATHGEIRERVMIRPRVWITTIRCEIQIVCVGTSGFMEERFLNQ